MLICDNYTYLTSGFCRTFTVTGLEDWSSLFISWTLKSLPKRKRSICKTRPVEFKYRKHYVSLYWSQVTHRAGVYPSFCSMKRLELYPLPLHGMLVHRKVTPLRVKSFAQEHNTATRLRLNWNQDVLTLSSAR